MEFYCLYLYEGFGYECSLEVATASSQNGKINFASFNNDFEELIL